MTGPAPSPVPTTARRSRGSSSARQRRAWDVATLAGWRSVAYRVSAALFLPPEQQRLSWLRVASGELRAYHDELAGLAFFGPWQRLLEALGELGEEGLPRLAQEYVRLFSVNPSGAPCFPYESCYVETDDQAAGWVSVHLQHTYRQAGLTVSPALHESPDHVAVELELMGYLCGQESEAWERAASDDAIRNLQQQRMFLGVHLARWFTIFARQVQATAGEPLYALAAEAADAFIHHDRDLVDLLSNDLKRLRSDVPS